MRWTDNFKKPEGRIGRFLLNGMNLGHGPVSKWGLSHYEWKHDTYALDVGCGGGMNIKRILALSPAGKAAGIDISPECIEKSKRLNRTEAGRRCQFDLAGVDEIPYPEGLFNVVTAFETIYFWPSLRSAFKEVRRVLRPGGTFLVSCEMSDPNCIWSRMVEGINIYTPAELKAYFEQFGFEDIRVDVKKPWVCVTGRKPNLK